MNFSGRKSRLTSPIFFLILGSVILRVIIYLLLPPAKEFEQYADSERLYFSALTEHFSEYFSFTTNIPPASYIINAALLDLVGIKMALHIRAFLILVSIMNIAAIAFLFNAAKKLTSDQRFSFLLISLFSAALIPFELWREGMHYDHFTLFFTSLFAWSLVRLIKDENSFFNTVMVSIAGALLVSQSAVNSVVVPASIFAILAFLYMPAKQYKKLALSLVITLFLPLVLLVAISKKNQNGGNESLTSNKGGPAMMMVVQRAYNYDVEKVRAVMKESDAPEWYLWTYDHATAPVDPSTFKPYPGWMNLSQAFGICFFDTPNAGNAPWSFNFQALLNNLRQNGPEELLQAVAADSADAASRPYLFAGYSPELSPRWIGIYGEFSKKIFFKTIVKNPLRMLKVFVIQQGIFAVYGPLFPYNTIHSGPSFLARDGLRTLQDKIPLHSVFSFVAFVFAIIAWVTYAIILLNIPVSIWKFLSGRGSLGANYFLLLSFPALMLAIVFSCLVGGENDRYFMQVTPYIVVLAACLPEWFKNLKRKSILA